MRVYRLVSEQEFELIKNGEKDKLGNFFDSRYRNNHKYRKNVKYIHFCKCKDDIEYIKELREKEGKKSEHYICEFDIPITKLFRRKGYGQYNRLDGATGVECIEEYAINIKNFDTNWLISYEKITIQPSAKPEFNDREEDELDCIFGK